MAAATATGDALPSSLGYVAAPAGELVTLEIDGMNDQIAIEKGQSSAAHFWRFERTCFRQAVAWDPSQPRVLFGISRGKREVVEIRVPAIAK